MNERPSIRQLEYLVALDTHRHFGRAAEACFVTQPALSSQLQQLEENLGVRLFERDRRKVVPTATGSIAIQHARRVLEMVDALGSEVGSLQDPLQGEVKLGIIPTIAPYLLPQVLPQVRQVHPNLKLMLYEDQTERLLKRVHAAELDLILLALPVPDHALHIESLFDEPFLLAVPPGHAMATRKRIRLEELEGEEILLLEDGH